MSEPARVRATFYGDRIHLLQELVFEECPTDAELAALVADFRGRFGDDINVSMSCPTTSEPKEHPRP